MYWYFSLYAVVYDNQILAFYHLFLHGMNIVLKMLTVYTSRIFIEGTITTTACDKTRIVYTKIKRNSYVTYMLISYLNVRIHSTTNACSNIVVYDQYVVDVASFQGYS